MALNAWLCRIQIQRLGIPFDDLAFKVNRTTVKEVVVTLVEDAGISKIKKTSINSQDCQEVEVHDIYSFPICFGLKLDYEPRVVSEKKKKSLTIYSQRTILSVIRVVSVFNVIRCFSVVCFFFVRLCVKGRHLVILSATVTQTFHCVRSNYSQSQSC